MKSLKLLAAGTLAVHLLTACGGGDSADGGTAPQARITADNAEQIANLVVEASNGIEEFGGMSSDLTDGSLTRGINTHSLDVSARSLSRLVLAPSGGRLDTVTAGPEIEKCPVSGSIAISANIQNPSSDTPTPGDSLSVTADQCESLDGVLNGGISLVIDRFTGDPANFPFEFAATLTLDNFSVQEGSEIATAHGGMTLAIGSEDGIVVTNDLSGSRISVSYGGKTHTLSAFRFLRTVDTATGAYSRFSEGILDGSNLEGAVTFRTPIPFQGLDFQYPHTGEMLIKGAEGSSLRLLALDSVNIRIEIDADGDGTYETTIDTTWEAIDS